MEKFSSGFAPSDPAAVPAVVSGDRHFPHVVVLDGAVVEDGCILGAGTLVPPNKVIPAGSVVVGNPYKIVRRANEKDFESILLNVSAYIELAKAYRGE